MHFSSHRLHRDIISLRRARLLTIARPQIDGKGKKYGEFAEKEFPNWGEEGMSMENPAMAMVGKTSKEELARRMSVQLQQAAGTW